MRKIGVGTWSCSDRERELVNQVLDSGRLSYGPMCRELERKFAEIHEAEFAILSNSGTSSLQVALQAMKEIHGWHDGDEVIIPALTFVATANIVLHNRMKPVLVDVDPHTYNMDVSKAIEAVTDKTRAIIPVHLFGQPADIMALGLGLPASREIKIIEDACEAAFAFYNGIPVGSMADITCFSTYVAHLLTTGVGGIATTDNHVYAAKMRSLVNHGRDGIYIDIDTDATREVVSKRFRFESIGHSFRITELEAAIGVAQLEKYANMLAKRSYNAGYLKRGLAFHQDRLRLPIQRKNAVHSWMMFPIVMLHESKWDIVNFLEDNGIETREMMPLTNQPCYAGMWDEDDYPVAKFINESGFYIGCHQDLTVDDLDYVIDTIIDYLEG